MIINVPEKVERIIRVLKENGYEAYAVGGCVRDSILKRVPGDWDITTSASPYEVKELFHRTIDTGIQHGTVTVMLDKEGFEVTTYRLDGEYEDCRHPKQVEFTKSLEEDLKRRDFTINAMAYNEEDGMVDLFEGLYDIKRRCIRCVGKAEDRFEEDALRILRAVRFSAQLNFEIEQETKLAIEKKAKNLANISAERIREELNKLFLSNYPEKLQIAYETGITNVVLPELDERKSEWFEVAGTKVNSGDFALEVLKKIALVGQTEQTMYETKEKQPISRKLTNKEKLCLSYASLLWKPDGQAANQEVEAESAKKVMRRLKFDNETIQCVTKLVRFGHMQIHEDATSVRKAMNLMGAELMDLWFLFQTINHSCMVSLKDPIILHDQKLYELYQEIMEAKQCVCLKDMKINGKDLITLGCEPGVQLGELLAKLLEHVLENPKDNSKDVLELLASKQIGLKKE